MKILKTNLISFAILLVLILMNSCSDGKLSNSNAEKVLKNEYPRYITSTVQISDKSLSPGIPQELKLLTERELARYRYIPPGNHGYGCYGELSEEGKQYYVGSVARDYILMAVAKVELDKVTGIREIPAMNTSEVEYTEIITEITPIGEIYNDIKVGKTYNVTATFVKYNDGWRINEISTSAKKITISDEYTKAMESQAKYTDVDEFLSAFKKAVESKDKKEISKFMYFPFETDNAIEPAKTIEEVDSNIGISCFDAVLNVTSLQKFGDNDYGIPGTSLKFSKHRSGYWKIDAAYGSPDFYR